MTSDVDPYFQLPPRIDVFAEAEGLNLPGNFLDAPFRDGEENRMDVEAPILEPTRSREMNENQSSASSSSF
ncbi:hypothetical protein J6590_013160 [Homalodisca vitripennis]|nr:hypothetical protein J6590_013160 [Homalodisca vitripennis]